MKVFDKEFEVELIKVVDNSVKGRPDVTVTFVVDGETYHYSYSGGPAFSYAKVIKEKEGGGTVEVYSPWQHIPDGHYYQEIGRNFSLESRKKKFSKS